MTWTDVWSTFAGAVAGGGALMVGAAFLSRALVNHWLDKDLEEHKQRLNSQAANMYLEYSTRFSHLHEKRAEAIESLYARFSDLDVAARELTKKAHLVLSNEDANSLVEDMWDGAVEAYRAADELFRHKKLYLDMEARKTADDLLDNYRGGILIKRQANLAGIQAAEDADRHIDSGMAKVSARLSEESYKRVHEKARSLLDILASQFQEFLDVQSDGADKARVLSP